MIDSTAPLVEITIDGVKVRVPKGTLLVEAAKLVQKEIPVYCYHTKLGPAGLCRICLVQIEGMPKLQIACNTPAADGMVVHTYNDAVDGGRRAVLEFLLLNHPLDCPICDKGGECDLQDYSMAYGQSSSRLADAKSTKPKAVDLGPTIVLDEERCIVCQRCVRFDDIITRERSLVVKDRGHRDIIATGTDEPYRSNYSGNVTELCPVGALTSKTYRFKARPWDLHRTKSTCTQCSVGCQVNIDEREGSILRVMSRPEDDRISDGWLCDRGRYNVGFGTDDRRLTKPLYKKNGAWTQLSWDDAIAIWAGALRDARAAGGPESLAVLGGGRLLNEEAYLLQHVFRSLGAANVDWRGGRQLQATPGRNAGSFDDLENAQAIIIVGQGPSQVAPVMDLRIRKAVAARGARLILAGSCERAPQIACESVETVAQALARIAPGTARIALVWDGVDPLAGAQLVQNLPAGATVRTYIAGEQPNARGAEAMGMHPAYGPGFAPVAAGRDFASLVREGDGALHAISVFGANPLLHFPDGAAVRDLFAKTPFVAVSEMFMTETAELATLVLPACGAFEKTGTTMNVTGDVLPVLAATTRPQGALSDFEMLVGLAEALQVPIPDVPELEGSVIRHLALAQNEFTLGDATLCGTAEKNVPSATRNGLHVRVESSIFSGGGTAAHDPSLIELRPLPQVAISAATAARFGLQTGDCVDLEGDGAALRDLLVEIRPTLSDDVVVLIDALPDAPANGFASSGALTLTNPRKTAELQPAGVS